MSVEGKVIREERQEEEKRVSKGDERRIIKCLY